MYCSIFYIFSQCKFNCFVNQTWFHVSLFNFCKFLFPHQFQCFVSFNTRIQLKWKLPNILMDLLFFTAFVCSRALVFKRTLIFFDAFLGKGKLSFVKRLCYILNCFLCVWKCFTVIIQLFFFKQDAKKKILFARFHCEVNKNLMFSFCFKCLI